MNNNQPIDLTSIDLINEDIHETIHVSSMRHVSRISKRIRNSSEIPLLGFGTYDRKEHEDGFQDVWAFDRLPYAELARNSSPPPSHLNLNKIPLLGFGTYDVKVP